MVASGRLLYPLLYALLYALLYSLLYSPTQPTTSTAAATLATLATLTAAPYGPPEPARAKLYYPYQGPASQADSRQTDRRKQTDPLTDQQLTVT